MGVKASVSLLTQLRKRVSTMRNCFTKVTNVFRKKALPERGQLSDEGSLPHEEDVYTPRASSISKTPKSMETSKTSTRKVMAKTTTSALIGCTSLSGNDKHSSGNNHDGANDKNNIEHNQTEIKRCDRDIGSTDKPEKTAANTSESTTPSLGRRVGGKHNIFRLSLNNHRRNMNESTNTKAHCVTRRKESDAKYAELYEEENGSLLSAEHAALVRRPTHIGISSTAIDKNLTNVSNNISEQDISERNNHSITTASTFESSDAKTPEEMEYEAKVAAEYEDVMTPLPTNAKHHQFAFGRNLRPEIAEVIRSLDANALRINNLTVEDKFELLRRFDSTQQARRHGRGNSYVRSMPPPGHSIQIDLGLSSQTHEEQQDDMSESTIDGVVLRRKSSKTLDEAHASGLYERRQPKSPKLKLVLEGKWKENANGTKSAVTFKDMNDIDCEVCMYF